MPGCLEAISTADSLFPVGKAPIALCSSCGQTGIYELDLCCSAIAWGEVGGKGLWTKVVQQPAPGAFQIYHFPLVCSCLVGHRKNHRSSSSGFQAALTCTEPSCSGAQETPHGDSSPWLTPGGTVLSQEPSPLCFFSFVRVLWHALQLWATAISADISMPLGGAGFNFNVASWSANVNSSWEKCSFSVAALSRHIGPMCCGTAVLQLDMGQWQMHAIYQRLRIWVGWETDCSSDSSSWKIDYIPCIEKRQYQSSCWHSLSHSPTSAFSDAKFMCSFLLIEISWLEMR